MEEQERVNTCICLFHTVFEILLLTCVGDGKAVGRFYVVHMRDQVKGGFRSVGAGVVKEDR